MRKELREQTRESHQRLDEFVGAIDPFSNEQSYKLYLVCMYRLYERYADPLDRSSKLAGLSRASEELRARIAEDVGFLPEAMIIPEREWTLAQVWASGYVLEGSAMGARYIVQQIDQSFSSNYLTRLASDSQQRWPAFVESLEDAPCDVGETVAAAREVFKAAAEIFSDAKLASQPKSGGSV